MDLDSPNSPEQDPELRELWKLYNAVGGTENFPTWVDMGEGISLNDIIEWSIHGRDHGPIRNYMEERAQIDMKHMMLEDFIDRLEEADLMDEGELTDYGQDWVTRTNRGIHAFYDMSLDGLIDVPEEYHSSKGFTSTQTGEIIGSNYSVLGFSDDAPETLPALHLLVENEDDLPIEYSTGLGKMFENGFLEDYSIDTENQKATAEVSDLGERIYNDIVKPDYRWMESRGYADSN